MKCVRCGSRAVVSNYDERRCGWEPPPPDLVCVAHAAVRCGVSVRTLRRWLDAGLVRGERGAGSGLVRLVDVVSVERYIAMAPRRWRQAGPLVTVREAATALGLKYKLVLAWARSGELPATAWDPRQSRRGRRVRLAHLEELVEKKKTVECAEWHRHDGAQGVPERKATTFLPAVGEVQAALLVAASAAMTIPTGQFVERRQVLLGCDTLAHRLGQAWLKWT